MSLVVFTEEPSMKAALEVLLPRIGVDPETVTIIEHQGVQDLEASLPRKLRAWRDPTARFLVLRDNDNGDCVARKRKLVELVNAAGRSGQAKVRIVCQELEAWFIGDRGALELSGLFGALPRSFPMPNPDAVVRPADRLLRIRPDYSKIAGAKAIAAFLDLDNPRSVSFGHTIAAVRQLCEP